MNKDKHGYTLEPETHRRLVWLKYSMDKPALPGKTKSRTYSFGEILDMAVTQMYIDVSEKQLSQNDGLQRPQTR